MTRAHLAALREPRIRDRSQSHPVAAWIYLALLLAVMVFFAAVRVRLRDMPLERDEGEYAYAGQLLLHGLAPYNHLYSMKLPGTYAAYALALAVFGESPTAVHLGLLAANLAGILLLFLIVRRMLGGLAAVVAAASFALLSAGAYVQGMSAHATHFVVLFALLGIWVLLRALESGGSALIAGAGVLFGMAFLMKQPGIVFAMWAAIYVLRQRWTGTLPGRRVAAQLGCVLAGAALPYAITCFVMLVSGEFRAFWFWTFSYLRNYGSVVPLADGFKLFHDQFKPVLKQSPAIWLLAFAGLTSFAWSVQARRHMFFAVSLLVFSFAGVSAGLFFRPHYFILLLPAISFLVGIAIGCATDKLCPKAKAALTASPALVFLLAFTSSVYLQRTFLFTLGPAQTISELYGANPFAEAVEIGRYIRAHTANTDTIAIIGSEPEICFYAQRLSATPYIYMYPLLEPTEYAAFMQRQMTEQIEAARPAMIVFVYVSQSWATYTKVAPMDTVLGWSRAYITANYDQDGLITIGPPAKYVWGEEARNVSRTPGPTVVVYRRK